MARIFISYRRDDSEYATDEIFDSLARHFEESEIFKDKSTIPIGSDFRAAIHAEARKCLVGIVVIGKHWINARDDQGQRRLENPADYVRTEIEILLNRGIAVIPVLLDGVTLPLAGELPDGIRDLANKQSLRIGRRPQMAGDLQQLIDVLDDLLDGSFDQSVRKWVVSVPGEWVAFDKLGVEVRRHRTPGEVDARLHEHHQLIIKAEQVTDADLLGLVALNGVESLNSLSIEQVSMSGRESFTDVGLSGLQFLLSLKSVKITNQMQLTDEGLMHLRGLIRLCQLSLARCHRLRCQPVAQILQSAPLTDLCLAGTSADDALCAALGQSQSLQKLDLMNCPVTDAGLAHFDSRSRLQELILAGTAVTDQGMQSLVQLPVLQKLDLAECRGVTEVGLAALGRSPSLKFVDVLDAGWSRPGLDQVRQNFPRIEFDSTLPW